MTTLESSASIDAPLREVFGYMTDPSLLLEWVTFLTHVHSKGSQIGPDACVACTIKVLGKAIQFDAVSPEKEENFTWKSGDHSSFSLESRLSFSGSTLVKWTLEYRLAPGVIGKLGEMAFLNYFRHEMQRSLERVSQEFRTRKTTKKF